MQNYLAGRWRFAKGLLHSVRTSPTGEYAKVGIIDTKRCPTWHHLVSNVSISYRESEICTCSMYGRSYINIEFCHVFESSDWNIYPKTVRVSNNGIHIYINCIKNMVSFVHFVVAVDMS